MLQLLKALEINTSIKQQSRWRSNTCSALSARETLVVRPPFSEHDSWANAVAHRALAPDR